MKHTLMASVAVAALFAATGLAMAQGGAKAPESPAAVAPKADSAAPMNAPAAKGAPDAKQLGDAKVDGKPKAAEGMAPATTSKDVKNSASETKPSADGKMTGEMKADGKAKATDSTTTSKDLKKPTAESKPAAPEGKTTGNAAPTAVAAPPAEKRTQITSAIKQEKVEEVTNVNFNLSIGTVVPTSVRYHPLPSRIVEIYPAWRGYEFILVQGRYVILRPHTHEIVYIIEG
ncbi:DUF1236 domain-containing protein [Bradyrhizobium tunisiense]|uniref:DUF1236 domain-containing protein n=1 Tax=Bradyrhizobium tunisiense TaxID=3278709 RepID=UPI0035D8C6E6